MAAKLALLAAAAAAAMRVTEARVNATSAIETFKIVDCEACVADDDSIFCTNAKSDSNFVKNATYTINIRMKKAMYGAADGSKYCWTGEAPVRRRRARRGGRRGRRAACIPAAFLTPPPVTPRPPGSRPPPPSQARSAR
jgi:hypothetical protein